MPKPIYRGGIKKIIKDKYLETAIKENPEGKICGSCKEENDLADDLGFFYQYNKEGKYIPVCNKCWIFKGGER